MIHNGFRRIALAHSLLPTKLGPEPSQGAGHPGQKPRTKPEDGPHEGNEGSELDAAAAAQDHSPVHM